MSVMVKRLLMRSRFDHQYFLQLWTSSSAMNQKTPLWTMEKSPMVKHTMKRWRGWILDTWWELLQAMKENHYQKINPVKCGVKLTCVLTGSYKDKTNRLNRLKRKWATRPKLSVLSDLWMELSSDLALKRPLTQANKQDIVNIRQSILTSWRFSHNISLYEPHLWNLFDHFIYLYLSFCNMVNVFFFFSQIKYILLIYK